MIYSGKKQCYKVSTENQEVEVTADHLFLTERGWIKCSDLKINDTVFVYQQGHRGLLRTTPKKTIPCNDEVCLKYHPTGSKKVINGYTYYRKAKYILEYEANKNNMSYKEYIKALNDHTMGLYFVPKGLHVHHIDRNRNNNKIENILILTNSEHTKLHIKEDKVSNVAIPTKEHVISIIKTDIKNTYDIQCEKNHNFFANDILVHNCGKSTWIKEHDLKQYTLSPDNIRLLYSAPELGLDGKYHISAKCDKHVWAFLRERLEARMKNGEFTVVDATHTREFYFKDYKKLCKEYNYRMVIVDFSSIDLDTCKERNLKRESYKRVSEEAIESMYNKIKIPLQGNYEIYDYDKLPNLDTFVYKIDGNKWKEVIVFGDIHSCYDPIRKYFDTSPESDEKLYIFVGDYFDRGIQAKEVLQFCLDHCEKENFVFLQGNHECMHKNTEILTKEGWLKLADIVDNQLNVTPITYNIQTKQLEYDSIVRYHKKKAEYLYDIKTNYSHQCVTANHDVLISDKKIKAKDITSKMRLYKQIKCCGNLIQDDACELSLDEIDLINWIVCDGTVVNRKRKDDSFYPHHLQFKLSRNDKLVYLEKLLNKMNIPYTKRKAVLSKYNKLQPYYICIYSTFAKKYGEIVGIGKNKHYPDSFKFLNKKQITRLYRSLVVTDGSVQGKRLLLTTVDKKNLDILTQAFVTNGYCCNIREKDNTGGFSNGNIYHLTITKNYVIEEQSISKKLYNDYVYCLTTGNGTLVTRFEGKVAITGNCWAKNYVRDGEAAKMTPDFKDSLAQFGELKDQLSKFTRRLKIAVKVIFGKDFDHHFFTITHGGLSKHLSIETPAIQCIKGVGNYEDLDQVEESFAKTNESWAVQGVGHHYYNVHGHRNINNNPIISSNGYNINLEGKVEFGGELRIVELNYDDSGMHINPIEIKNDTFKEGLKEQRNEDYTNKSIISDLEHSSLIRKKDLGDGIVSYNFSREAFYSQKWNKLTTTARGLFVDTKTNKVVARSYPKFFEAEQHPSTQWRNLEKKLVFPVTAYLKENGFLGIVSVWNDQLFVASKSTNQGDYALNFQRILNTQINCDKLKEYLKKNNCSAIFECVDPFKDPHIIEYVNEKVVLLDIVQNDFTDTFKSYDEVFNLAKEIGCKPKEMCKIFNTFEELKSFVEAFDKDDKNEIEGFVFVDQNNFMLKYKTPFYKFWKDMRRMKDYINKGSTEKYFAAKNVLPKQTELMNRLFRYMTGIKQKGIDLDTLSIIDIRNKYLQENL